MAIRKALRADVPLLPLSGEAMETFRDRHCQAGWLPKDSLVYRYGSDETQARWSRGQWVNVTEDLFHFTDEALEKCALLDATFWTMETEQETAQREKAKREAAMRIWRNPSPEYQTAGNKPAPIWNSAAWRATLIALEDVPVYFGVAGPMAFDLSTGKRYRGQGDQTAHRAYPGGASQILISGMAFDKFTFVPPERLMWTRWPQHHWEAVGLSNQYPILSFWIGRPEAGENSRLGEVDLLRNEDESLERNQDLVRHKDCSILEQHLQAIRIARVTRISP